jgi:hypothetical protein
MRSRSGGLISVVDGVTCDDAASVAKKTKPDNQSLGIAVLQRLKLAVVLALLRTVAVCEKNHDSLDTNDDFTPLRQRSTFLLSSNCCNQAKPTRVRHGPEQCHSSQE